MHEVLAKIGDGISNGFLMAWQVWWALVLGFAISAVVQAWVPRQHIERALSGSGPGPVALATGLGAASSSCSYAAIAISKSLFAKGASAAASLAFAFASTNLVIELGIPLWVLLGWRFTAAEFVGGLLLIVAETVLVGMFISRRLQESARRHSRGAGAGHGHVHAGSALGLRARLRSAQAWSDVAHKFRGDMGMLWREIAGGFLLAGFIGLLPNRVFADLFVGHCSHVAKTLENVLVGPVVAALSFVCSVGNVPVAAVLWSGGVSFAGVIAFLFADLLAVPILLAYRRYYGGAYALRIAAVMFAAIVIAALVVGALFGWAGLLPNAHPGRARIFVPVTVDYRLALNVGALAVFGALMALTVRRGAQQMGAH